MTDRTTTSLFEEAYWLDAVAPGRWSAVEVARDGVVIGRLPYAIVRRYGQSAIAKPWYTPWLGPWIRPSLGSQSTQIGNQHQVLRELIAGLPKTITSTIFCAPEQSNMMAFHWAGWRLGMAYTHQIKTGDNNSIWLGLKDKVRNQIRKSENKLIISNEKSVNDAINIIDKTFKRQGIDVSKSYNVLEKIDETMKLRGQRKIFTAEDSQGNIHAAMYLVHDEKQMFYIAGGADPEFRHSNAQSLLMWHAIKEAANHAPIFDFAGSMVPSIEHFIRGFGASQIPRYSAERHAGVGKLIDIMRAVRA